MSVNTDNPDVNLQQISVDRAMSRHRHNFLILTKQSLGTWLYRLKGNTSDGILEVL